MEEKKGVFHDEEYVYRKNLLVFEKELTGAQRTREMITAMDTSRFSEISDFRAEAIAIIIQLIKRMNNGTAPPPFFP
jgi:hypothetical protein